MAAILLPTPETYRPIERFSPPRPRFTVIEGGRSDRHLAVVYRRRRVVAAFVVLLLGVATLALAHVALLAVTPHAPAAASASSSSMTAAHTVVVHAGDSYWSIARHLHPNGDVRSLVDRLSAEHGSAPLQPGDVLSVP